MSAEAQSNVTHSSAARVRERRTRTGAGFTESGTAGALNIVSALNTTSIKNSTFQKIATAPAATSRHVFQRKRP